MNISIIPSRSNRSTGGLHSVAWMVFLSLAFLALIVLSPQGRAGAPAGYGKFVIPGDEDVLVSALEYLGSNTQNGPMHSVIAVTAWADDTVIYYDHWEDGYDFDPDDPDTADATFVLTKTGDGARFESADIPLPRPTTIISCADTSATTGAGSTILLAPGSPAVGGNGCRYDGRDILYSAGGAITVTRSSWDQDTSPLQSLAWEVFPVRPQLIQYIMPFGEDLSATRTNGNDSSAATGDYTDFETVYALIQATGDNTVVQIDFDGDGTFDPIDEDGNGSCTDDNDGDGDNTTIKLGAGENFLLSRNSDGNGGGSCMSNHGLLRTGTIVLASETIQMQYIIGDYQTGYEVRGLSAFPRGFWDDEYYAPVDNPTTNTGRPVDIFLFNPHATSLTIEYQTSTASGSFVIQPRDQSDGSPSGVMSLREVIPGGNLPADSSIYLKGSDVFWGISTIDSEGVISDWAYSLVPASFLGEENYLGWAPEYDSSAGTNDDASGIFLTAAQDNITLFIDTDNDGAPEDTFTLDRLETLYYTDPDDIDLSQAHIYATGPYTLAYGQNADFGISGNSAGYDVGYTVLPAADDWYDLALTVAKATDPVTVGTGTGEITRYTIVVGTHEYDMDDIAVVDTLATGWGYCTGTDTPASGCLPPVVTFPDGSTSGDAPSVNGQDLTWGSAEFTGGQLDMGQNQQLTVEYYAYTTAAHAAGSLTTSPVVAIGERTVGDPGVTQTFTATDRVFNLYTTSEMTITKSSNVTDVASPGDTIEYTVVVENPGSTALTDVSIYDPIPTGVAYVAGSGELTGTCAATDNNVADDFNPNDSYSGNDGSVNWANDWSETNDGGGNGGATGGDIEAEQGRLEFQDSTDGGESVQRSAAVTGATSITISYDFADNGLDGNDDLIVQYSSDGGSNWTDLQTLDGNSSNTTYSHTISWDPTDSAIILRFYAENGFENNEEAYFDNVDITYSVPTTGTFASNDPPNFATGCSIAAGGTLTLTFDATVNDPLATGIAQITNTASSTSAEVPIPVKASVTDPVNNPSSQSATVGDRIWLDSNGDGLLGVGESGLAGVEVTLKDQYGTPLQVTTSDSQGRYSFTGVASGSGYYVDVTGGLPAGLTQTTDGRTDDRTNAFDLASGQTYLSADLGYRAATGTTVIGDLVWSDGDGDGARDPGEPGLAGVTVRLYTDTNGNGLIDTGETYVETTTGADGGYLFNVAATGTQDYIAYIDSAQSALSAYSATTGISTPFGNVASGKAYLTADFGFVQTAGGTTYSIQDRIWLDNGAGGGTADDGSQNGSESGIGGVTVALLDASGNVIATTTSDSSGNFSFSGVPAGKRYSWRITDQNAVLSDFYGTTSYAQAEVFQMPATLSGNLDYTSTPHFGYNVTRSVGDTVFNDSGAGGGTAGNGTQDGSEPGISGVTVLLYRDVDNDGNFEPGGDDGAAVASLVTDANGKYLFSGLNDGRYWVSIDNTQTALGGYDDLTTDDDEAGSGGHQREVNLSGGVSVLDIDYGYRATTGYSLSGVLWDDAGTGGGTANNGVQDGTESGLGNVTLELVQNGVAIGTATTASDGSYSFDGLPAGTAPDDYTVRITDTNGVLSGYSTSFEKTEGAGAGTYNDQETVTVSLSADVTDLNFGFYKPIPTLALVRKLKAYAYGKDVIVEWRVSSEHGTLGYYLERLDESTGEYVALHDDLLPGFIQAPQGGTYWLLDPDAQAKERHSYRLIEVEVDNDHIEHGPFEIKVKNENTGRRIVDAWDSERIQDLWDDGFARERKEPSAARIAKWQAKQAKRAAKAKKPKKAFKSGKSQLRISVVEDGLHRLGVSEIAAAFGVKDKLIARYLRKGKLALSNGGEEVAYFVADDDSALYYYGEGIDTRYTDTNVYWLGVGNALFMTARDSANAAPAHAGASFPTVARWEENHIPVTYLIGDPDGEYWYWGGANAGQAPFKIESLDAPGSLASGQAMVALELRGGGESAPGLDDHHVEIWLNDVKVGEGHFDGTNRHRIEAWFEQGISGAPVILATDNRVEVRAIKDNGVPSSFFWVDSVELGYRRDFVADGDRLRLTPDGTEPVSVQGFASDDIVLLDIGDPRRPALLSGILEEDADAYSLSFSPATANGAYLATSLSAAHSPAGLESDELSTLNTRNNRADYLIIIPYALQSGAQTLADLRQAEGLKARVVDLQDIYNAFTHGVADAHAIRAFLDYAYREWKRAPRYIALAGKGTIDPRNFWGYGTNVLPVVMADSPFGLVTSDNRYADVVGDDGVPDMAIGRIPVLTDEELQAYADKLAAYQGQGLGTGAESWQNRAIMVADVYPDPAGNFPDSTESVIALLPTEMTVDRHYAPSGVDDADIAAFRDQLKEAIGAGSGLVNFIGHGSIVQFGKQAFFTTDDVADLTNGARLPVVAALTCAVGWDSYPGVDSLAGKLALHAGGGASAVLAPSGLSYNDPALELNRTFVEAAYMDSGMRIGEAVQSALYELSAIGGPRYMIDMYGITGDPAVAIPPVSH